MPKPMAAPAKAAKVRVMQPAPAAAALVAAPLRNSDFPNTYIDQISVQLDDPDHSVTLTWTGPQAAAQEIGPSRSPPAAGLNAFTCDDVSSSSSHRSAFFSSLYYT